MRKLQELTTKLKVKRHALPSRGYLSSKPLLEERFTLGVATAEEEAELSGRWAELQKQPREQLH